MTSLACYSWGFNCFAAGWNLTHHLILDRNTATQQNCEFWYGKKNEHHMTVCLRQSYFSSFDRCLKATSALINIYQLRKCHWTPTLMNWGLNRRLHVSSHDYLSQWTVILTVLALLIKLKAFLSGQLHATKARTKVVMVTPPPSPSPSCPASVSLQSLHVCVCCESTVYHLDHVSPALCCLWWICCRSPDCVPVLHEVIRVVTATTFPGVVLDVIQLLWNVIIKRAQCGWREIPNLIKKLFSEESRSPVWS